MAQQHIALGKYKSESSGKTYEIKWDRSGKKVHVGQWHTNQSYPEDKAFEAGKALIRSKESG